MGSSQYKNVYIKRITIRDLDCTHICIKLFSYIKFLYYEHNIQHLECLEQMNLTVLRLFNGTVVTDYVLAYSEL